MVMVQGENCAPLLHRAVGDDNVLRAAVPAEGANPQPALASLFVFGFPRASALGGVGAPGMVLSGESRNPEWVQDEGFTGEVWGCWAWKAVSQRAFSSVGRSREVPGSVLRSQEPSLCMGQ